MTTQTIEDSLIETMPNEKLASIAKKVTQGTRLSKEDGVFLFETEHESAVHQLADYARKKMNGDLVYYCSTLFVHPTNLCELSCSFCSFYSKPGWKSAWFNKPEQILKSVEEAYKKGVNEIHFVGGLWRDCDLDYYKECFTGIKAIDPNLHIKALTAIEYDFLARHHDIPVEEVFEKMIEWGLNSLPGGGAEILVEEVRKKIAPQKISSDRYLEVHSIAHKLGLRSNITMLFGHIEEEEDIVGHFCRVREQQDKTQGIQAFVPLKYHTDNNALGKRTNRLKPKNEKRIYAVARLMLDNVRNIKVLWNYLGVKKALEILQCGGNDLASTAIDEKIIVMAGGVRVQMTADTMETLIQQIGRVPKRIHSGHNYEEDKPYALT